MALLVVTPLTYSSAPSTSNHCTQSNHNGVNRIQNRSIASCHCHSSSFVPRSTRTRSISHSFQRWSTTHRHPPAPERQHAHFRQGIGGAGEVLVPGEALRGEG